MLKFSVPREHVCSRETIFYDIRCIRLGVISLPDEPLDFQLSDQNLVMRSLKDFRGQKIVLAFFPGAFTSVCTKEMCAFRDSMKSMMELGAQVVAISVNDPFTNKAFADVNQVTVRHSQRLHERDDKKLRCLS